MHKFIFLILIFSTIPLKNLEQTRQKIASEHYIGFQKHPYKNKFNN